MRKIVNLIFVLVIICIYYICFVVNDSNNKTELVEMQEEWKQTKFDLRDKIQYKCEYQIQATYRSCWAYGGLDCIETNLLLQQNVNYDFSESYNEYITSNLFGGNRELDSGNRVISVFEKNGEYQGPVLEREVPNRRYEKTEYNLFLNAKPIVKKVNYISFISDNVNLKEKVKKHIVENSSITAPLYFEPLKENVYNPETHAYHYQKEGYNHVVSIIGWDDEYPRENFPEENRPEKDGAYLVNPFWKDYGIIYVSYEDANINSYMIGVEKCELYDEN